MTWEVYGLIDPRNDKVFYIGCSKIGSKNRAKAHGLDSASSAYWIYRDIEALGLVVGVCIFGSFNEKISARVLEGRLILALPDIVNNKKNWRGLPSSILYPGWHNMEVAGTSERTWYRRRAETVANKAHSK